VYIVQVRKEFKCVKGKEEFIKKKEQEGTKRKVFEEK
jgi:hypothetical protein